MGTLENPGKVCSEMLDIIVADAVVPEQPDFQQFIELEIPKVLIVIKIIYSVWLVFGMTLI